MTCGRRLGPGVQPPSRPRNRGFGSALALPLAGRGPFLLCTLKWTGTELRFDL